MPSHKCSNHRPPKPIDADDQKKIGTRYYCLHCARLLLGEFEERKEREPQPQGGEK